MVLVAGYVSGVALFDLEIMEGGFVYLSLFDFA